MSDWTVRVICKCGWSERAPFGDPFHVHTECCPRCGSNPGSWKVRKARTVSEARWWNPLTWFDTRLEIYSEGAKLP